jgi:Rod binding domain-containing protein
MASNSLPLPESSSAGRGKHSQAPISVAKEFESVFASMMLKEMRQSLEPSSLFGHDSGDIYGGLFDRMMGEELTKGQGLGMASMICKGIERQEKAARQAQLSRPDDTPIKAVE